MGNRRCLITLAASILLALCALAGQVITAQAGPPAPIDIVLTQPDGTTISARQWGDEWQNGLETLEGYTLLLDEPSGYWVYAERQADGQLAPALRGGQPLRAGIDLPGDLLPHARPAADLAPQTLRAAPSVSLSGLTRAAAIRDQKLLVILGTFNDQPNNFPAATFRERAFGATGSIKHYYTQASASQLNYVPANESWPSSDGANDGVVGWVSLNMAHPNDLTDTTSRTVARAALSAADPYINYSEFDSNGDGYVTADELHVLIIVAGCEGSSVCPNGYKQFWAHMFDLDFHPLKLDEVFVAQNSAGENWLYGGYAIVSESHNYSPFSWSPSPATVGVMVHELGHMLGWPDLYDISGRSNGVGRWSLMGSGSWNNAGGLPGSSPALPDAWLKWYQGWVQPVQAPDTCLVGLSAPSANILLIGSNPGGVDWDFQRHSGQGEYWLLENRPLTGYDAGLPAGGLLLWHIDETADFTNSANNTNPLQTTTPGHRLVALEQADGRDDLFTAINRGDSGDPYPGSNYNLAWGSATTPNSLYNNGQPSGFSLKVEGFQLYLPVTVKQIPVTGRLTSAGSPVAGQPVALLYTTNGWSSYSTYATTVSDAGGNFWLPMPPLTNSQQRYQLSWRNTANNEAWLGNFYSNEGTYQTSSHRFDMDIANVRLASPKSGASVFSPTTYIWTPRSTNSDNYRVILTDSGGSNFAVSGNLYYTDRATIGNLPYWVIVGAKYYWFIEVTTPAGAGYSYWMNAIYFQNIAGPPLENTAPSAWLAGEQMGMSPNLALARPRPLAAP